MKVITANEIERVLDDCLAQYLRKEYAFKNVIFFGEEGVGKSYVINKWFEKNEGKIEKVIGKNPQRLYKETKEGFFVPEDPERLAIPYDKYIAEKINSENVVLYYSRFYDCLFDENANKQIEDLICNRLYYDCFTEEKHSAKWFLCVMESLPENEIRKSKHKIPKNIINCSDVYYVEPSAKEFKDYLLCKLERIREAEAQNNEGVKNIENQMRMWTHILSSEDFRFMFDDNNYFSPLVADECVNYCLNRGELDFQSLKNKTISFLESRFHASGDILDRPSFGYESLEMLKKIMADLK